MLTKQHSNFFHIKQDGPLEDVKKCFLLNETPQKKAASNDDNILLLPLENLNYELNCFKI